MKENTMAKNEQAYRSLTSLSKRARTLDGISSLLGWDQETYMPEKGAPIRAIQNELIAELSHSIKTSPEFEKTLSSLIDLQDGTILASELTEQQKSALIQWRRDFLRQKKLPTSFVQEFAKLTSESIFVWDKAKKTNDFALFAPHLSRIVEMIRKKCDYIGYDDHPYDALIDEYEPGIKTADVEKLFSEIKVAIPQLVVELLDREESEFFPSLEVHLTQDEQIKVCKKVLDSIGYDFTRGRLDLSSHPFSSSCHPSDCRITTRLESHGFVTQVLTTLHEAGHSFYEMGLPEEEYGTPLGDAISLGIHENESRTWETRIGRTLGFWRFLLPQIQNMFPGRLDHLTPETLFKAMSKVEASFIRTDSDEVTYPLHVILRFEIEKELIEGKLAVKDLPNRWNTLMKELLGILPKNNQEGVLQDIHWSMGAFGYFPTYTLGNIFAANLFETFSQEFPNWQERIEQGQFDFIKEWHRTKIHVFGKQYLSHELVEKITGKKVTAEPYINYLINKYRP